MKKIIIPALFIAILAQSWFGFSSIYYKAISSVPPLEVLAHRALWSILVVGLFCLATGRLHRIIEVTHEPRNIFILFVTSVFVSANWFGFIYAIQMKMAVEASLGYFMLPLCTALMGMIFLRERLGKLHHLALGIAALAVTILSIGLNAAPWVAFYLSLTFAIYSLIRKQLDVGPIVAMFWEVILMAPIALWYLWSVHSSATGGAFGQDIYISVLIALSGVMTAVPLILFAEAARPMQLSTTGIIQFINPTLQFFVAVIIFAEPITQWHAISFPLIWVSVALYSFAMIRKDKSKL